MHWDAGNIASHAGLISMLQQLGLRDDSCDLLIRLMKLRGMLGVTRMWMNMPPGEQTDLWRTDLARHCADISWRRRAKEDWYGWWHVYRHWVIAVVVALHVVLLLYWYLPWCRRHRDSSDAAAPDGSQPKKAKKAKKYKRY